MASNIPLPALHVAPSEAPDPLAQVGKLLSVRSLLNQQQGQQLQLQQQGQAVKDQQATTAAMHAWDGKDYDALAKSVLDNGGSATAAQSIAAHGLSVKKTASEIAKDDAATGKTNLDTEIEKHNQLLGKLEAAKSAPDQELAPHLQDALNSAVQSNFIKPEEATQLWQKLSQLPPDQQRNAVGIYEKSLMGQKEQFTQAQTERENKIKQQNADTSEWKEAGQGTLVNLKTGQIIHGVAPVEQQELQDYLNKHKGKGPADFAAWKASLSPQATVNVQNAAGPPVDLNDPSVQGVANGDLKLQDVLTARTPIGQRKSFIAAVKQVNPNFKSLDYDIEKGVMKSATSGKIGDNLTAFNTAIDHARQLQSAADALDNGDIRTLNSLGNKLGYEFGSDKTTNFNVIKNALAGEISKVFKGGQATDAEIHAVQAPFDAANSPKQLKGAIQQAISLMNSKRDALKHQVELGREGKANFGDEADKPKSESDPLGIR